MSSRSRAVGYSTPDHAPDSTESLLTAFLIEHWLRGANVTTIDVVRGCAGDADESSIRKRLAAWAKAGVLALGDGPRRASTLISFNATGRGSDAGALGAALSAFLTDESIAKHTRQGAAAAVRAAIKAPRFTGAEALAGALDRLPPAEAVLLPDHAVRAFEAEGHAAQSVANRLSALRAFLRYAAERRLIVLTFPVTFDRYIAASLRYFATPAGANKAVRKRLRASRTQYLQFVARARHVAASDPEFGPWPEDPDDMSAAQAERVLRGLKKEGANVEARVYGAMLAFAAAREFGPFRKSGNREGINPWRVNRENSVALRDPDGASTSEWPATVRMLVKLGFPATLTDFLVWLYEYLTLDRFGLDAQPERFPIRPERRQLQPQTLATWNHALKLFLGAAVSRCQLRPEALTPEEAFGTHYPAVAKSLFDLWAERHREGVTSSPFGPGLERTLVTAGLLAETASDYLYHRRTYARLGAAAREADPFAVVDLGRTARELTLLRTKELAYEQARWLAERRTSTAATRAGTTRKDLQRLVESVPMAAVEQVHADALAEARGRSMRGDDSAEFHGLVADTFLNGVQLSVAARAQELTHVRLDIQYPLRQRRGDRMITLRGTDRKQGGGAHFMFLLDKYVPRWLEDLYLERSRPYFVAKLGDAARLGVPLAGHQFLFVDRHGQPFGCVEEDDQGLGRNKKPWRERVSTLVSFSKNFLAPRLHALGHDVPLDWGELTLHALRARAAHATIRVAGLEEAVALLGDRPETVFRSYVGHPKSRRDGADPYGTAGTLPRAAEVRAADIRPDAARGRRRSPRTGPSPEQAREIGSLPADERRALAAELHRKGMLTDDEFFALLKRISDGGSAAA